MEGYEEKFCELVKCEEELQFKIVMGESNNKVVDQKVVELSREK